MFERGCGRGLFWTATGVRMGVGVVAGVGLERGSGRGHWCAAAGLSMGVGVVSGVGLGRGRCVGIGVQPPA